MPPISKMRKLPPEVLAEVNRCLADGMTVENLANLLKTAGHDVSAAGVGRYRKWWSEHVEPTLAYRAFVDATTSGRTDRTENRAGILNVELIQAQLAEALTELKGSKLPVKKRIEVLATAAVAQAKLSTARREEIMGMIRLADYQEALEAREGELLKKQNGKLVRIEFVDAKALEAPKSEATTGDEKPAGEAKV